MLGVVRPLECRNPGPVAVSATAQRRMIAATFARRASVALVVSAYGCLAGPTAQAQWSGSATRSYGMGAISLGIGNLSLGQRLLAIPASTSPTMSQ
jgi:hypothetical protein